MSERPVFGTVGFYQAMADALNSDAEWLEKGKNITCTMSYAYEAPVSRVFFLAFESGKVTDVKELGDSADPPAEIQVSGPPDNWKSLLKKEVKPTVAIATGKLKVKGKQTYLLKNMPAFSHILDVMTQLDPVYD